MEAEERRTTRPRFLRQVAVTLAAAVGAGALASRAWANPEAAEQMNPDVVPGTLIGKRQFGLIRVSGPGNDRRLALESYDTEGVRLWRHEVRARDLRFSRTGPE